MKIKIKIPTSWNELSQRQFEKIALLFYNTQPSLKQDKAIFKILVGAKWWQFVLIFKQYYILHQVPMRHLREQFLFLFKENNRTHFTPVIYVGLKKYYAPMNRLLNITAEEFAVADDLHQRYRQEKEIAYLIYLFHALYSKNKNRGIFDKLALENKVLEKIPLATLLATEIAYFGSKNHIIYRYPKIFKTTNSQQSGTKTGFSKVIQGMAKGDLSKLKIVEQINIYKFLDQFQDDIESIQQQKMKQK